MEPKGLDKSAETPEGTEQMPVLFVGHGSPMNAIEDNEFSRGWWEVGLRLPKPKAILCISAHWETRGTLVTAMDRPRTIHDFGGFPRALFEVQYPTMGSQWLAQETKNTVKKTEIGLDEDWGLDHGCWSVLIIGSGNMVHNLRRVVIRGNDISEFNRPFGLDWAIEANELFKKLINEEDHQALIDYQSLGEAVQLAVPTPEHYLPLLYAIALKQGNESITYFNDKPLAGSLTMTSLLIDRAH